MDDQTSEEWRTRRLGTGERDLARRLFLMMADVFGEPGERLSDDYLDRLLGRQDFWAIAACHGDEIIGGLTAHSLAMTKAERTELFIFDVAVRPEHQRRGVGRRLVTALQEMGAKVGIGLVFVAADNDDAHALDFYRALGGAPTPVTMFTFE